MSNKYKPGEKVSESGIYQEYDKNGKKVGKTTSVQGEPFPPTKKSGGYYKIDTPTKNKK